MHHHITKRNILIAILPTFMLGWVLISCESNGHQNNPDYITAELPAKTDSIPVVDQSQEIEISLLESISFQQKAHEFCQKLEKEERLSPFFANNWTFSYHEDNRCDGATTGEISPLQPEQIDTTILLSVKNDGEGWACEKHPESEFELRFQLTEQIQNWNRFEVLEEDTQMNDRTVYIAGSGESDYLVLLFDIDNAIIKLEYRSEDPG